MGQSESKQPTAEGLLHFAVVGDRGSGKSSFINAIRGLEDHDDLAVPTGLGLTTTEPSCRSHPENSDIILWDLPLPSINTPSSYERLSNETIYDAFLIFTSERFTTNYLDLAKQLEATNKPFFMIRTNLDQDLRRECSKKTFNEDEMLKNIRGKILRSLRVLRDLHCSEEDVFLISNHDPEKWDFQRLKEEILSRQLSAHQIKSTNTENKESMLNHLKKHLHEAKCTIEEKGVKAAQKLMEDRLKRWKEIKITLAITGDSGAGKSSFINAIRGLKDDDDESAKTGTIEMTMDPVAYLYPSNPKITLWDLPGVGTLKFPDLTTYCKKVDIAKYDTFIIMCSTRFTKDDMDLAKKLTEINKPFLFVRSKIDQAYANEEKKKDFDEEKMLEKIRNDCSNNLDQIKSFDKKNIFLISKDEPQKYDFPRLAEAISNQLPLAKQESFNLSMYILSEDVLRRKVKTLRGRIKWLAAFHSLKADMLNLILPHDDMSTIFIHECARDYKSKLGLPDKESEEFSGMTKELKKAVQRFDLTMGVKPMLKQFGDDEGTPRESFAKAFEKPYSFIYRSLNFVLDEMAEIALAILDEIEFRSKNERAKPGQ